MAPSKDDEEEPSKEQSNQTEDTDIEQGLVRKKEKGASKTEPKVTSTTTATASTDNIRTSTTLMDASEKTLDEDSLYIEVPALGLSPAQQFLNSTVPTIHPKLRLAQNMCSICLCNYEVGSDIVWSSNELCDHVFHEQCIEQWLLKQREGPLCPCCRRDFIMDPYDLEDEEELDPQLLLAPPSRDELDNDIESGTAAAAAAAAVLPTMSAAMYSSRISELPSPSHHADVQAVMEPSSPSSSSASASSSSPPQPYAPITTSVSPSEENKTRAGEPNPVSTQQQHFQASTEQTETNIDNRILSSADSDAAAQVDHDATPQAPESEPVPSFFIALEPQESSQEEATMNIEEEEVVPVETSTSTEI